MGRRFAILLIGLALGTAVSAAPGTAERSLLSAADLDPKMALPAPPAADSTQARAELAELKWVQSNRSDADLAAARADDETKSVAIFTEVLGPRFDLKRLPQTKRLFDIVRVTEKDVADRGKAEFLRPRPWIVDPTIESCSREDKPLSSYPSGHTTMGFSMAAVLARLVPNRAAAIMARAARYGQSRIVCEMHFRSDVTAGEALGLLVAERLMTKPGFVAMFNRSRLELRNAGLR